VNKNGRDFDAFERVFVYPVGHHSSMMDQIAVLVLGSEGDLPFSKPIRETLESLGVDHQIRIASAHKDSQRLIDIIEDYESREESIVFITVAGMSNALSGFLDFKTRHPVIACPNLTGDFALVDVYSSLRMPSGVAPLVILSPKGAAIAAAKIFGEVNSDLAGKIRHLHETISARNEEADRRVSKNVSNQEVSS
jgi:5-(carboxyamino)imidazole ribonucleotide mutase